MFSVENTFDAGTHANLTKVLGRLPMFPLPNIVLFPNALLPLHIFEDRYRKMVRDVLASHKLIAVSLLLGNEHEYDGKPPVAPIAGVGEVILAHELPDGKFNLVLRGRARIHIDSELPSDEPYRLISATEIPDDPTGNRPDLMDADASLRALVGGLANAIPEGGDLLKQVVAAQETPGELVDVLASALVVDSKLRQLLLETTDVGRRIEQVSAEVAAMTARITPGSKTN